MGSTANDFLSMRFSTDGLPERSRLDIVRELIGRSIMGVDISPLADTPMRSDLSIQSVPGLGIITSVSTGLRVERTRGMLADGSDDLVLAIQLDGVTIASQRSREFTARPGTVLLQSRAEPGQASFLSASRATGITIPRAALTPLVADLDDAVMRPLAMDGEALRLLMGYLRELANGNALADPELRRLVLGHVYDLVALVIGTGREATIAARSRGLRAARLRAIVEAIQSGFTDPAFSVQSIVRRLGLSQRYIQDLLQESGASFTDRVLELRLQNALAMLRDPTHDALKVIDVAYACGFNDVSYFNRCFRRRFGASPTELR
jgi:AraC-like DNA-binding protein